jgi:glycosyltransferase involved in cell wall biosynthesis
MQKPRVLFLLPGPVPPRRDEKKDRFYWLSQEIEGFVLLPVWWDRVRTVAEKLDVPESLELRRGNLTYRFFLQYAVPRPLWKLAALCFYLRHGLRFSRAGGGYDSIVCYGTNLTGIAARLLKLLTGAKLIVEIPGVPHKAFVFDQARRSRVMELKRFVAGFLLKFVLRGADGIRTLYPEQLAKYPAFPQAIRRSFHEFVPVASLLSMPAEDQPYILLLGHPWYLKGVDLAIQAFHQISREFPDIKLKIVGYCEDRSPFEELRAGEPRIEFHHGVDYEEAMRMISCCRVLVLPSRTEAMGRVLLEGMSFKKSIAASAVDGIPFYVQHEENGLLVPPENPDELAGALRRLLADEPLRRRLGESGYRQVKERFSEEEYSRQFGELIRKVNERE